MLKPCSTWTYASTNARPTLPFDVPAVAPATTPTPSASATTVAGRINLILFALPVSTRAHVGRIAAEIQDPRGQERQQGRQDSNLQPPVLEPRPSRLRGLAHRVVERSKVAETGPDR